MKEDSVSAMQFMKKSFRALLEDESTNIGYPSTPLQKLRYYRNGLHLEEFIMRNMVTPTKWDLLFATFHTCLPQWCVGSCWVGDWVVSMTNDMNDE